MAEATRHWIVRCGAFLIISMATVTASLAASSNLPAKAPQPSASPQPQKGAEPATTDEASESGLPPNPPTPEPRPEAAATAGKRLEQITPDAPHHTVIIPPRPARSTDEDAQCLKELGELGVTFEKQKPVTDPMGCAIANPVMIKDFGKSIGLVPEALLDCPMALAATRFLNQVASGEAKKAFGSDLTSISQASAYVCRPRNGGEKLSEHAFGNALDVASFGLADKRRIEVKAGTVEPDAGFLAAVRKAACGPFKTVLGPGSDADHALHFHFDLAWRRSGSTFCQ
jgi:hypothetical protein